MPLLAYFCLSARNFRIKKELFQSKVVWQCLLFAGYCGNKIYKIVHFKVIQILCKQLYSELVLLFYYFVYQILETCHT